MIGVTRRLASRHGLSVLCELLLVQAAPGTGRTRPWARVCPSGRHGSLPRQPADRQTRRLAAPLRGPHGV